MKTAAEEKPRLRKCGCGTWTTGADRSGPRCDECAAIERQLAATRELRAHRKTGSVMEPYRIHCEV